MAPRPGPAATITTSDCALLELDEPVPDTLSAERLLLEAAFGQTFRAFGFPRGYDNGVTVQGEFLAPDAGGWLELREPEGTGYFIEPGFSGAPVFAADSHAVLGIVVAAARESERRRAFVIPTVLLHRAWPLCARPYRGLRTSDEAHARDFFGRDAFVDQVEAKLSERPPGRGHRRLGQRQVLDGPRRPPPASAAPRRLSHRPMPPRRRARLAPVRPWLCRESLLRPSTLDLAATPEGAQHWERDHRKGPDKLVDAVQLLAHGPSRRFLLVVDQFEELFTVCEDEYDRNTFIELVLAISRGRDRRRDGGRA